MRSPAPPAQAIIDHGAAYLLAVKDNQPTLRGEMAAFFDTAQPQQVATVVEVDKDHGRIETRRCVVSHHVDWLASKRRFPGEYRFATLTAIAMVEARIALRDRCSFERRFYICSAPLSAARCAQAVRAHWRIESMHWVLDVLFGEDRSRLRTGHGAHNMAIVRHFALNLLRRASDTRSLKRRRKCAGWDTHYLANLLQLPRR